MLRDEQERGQTGRLVCLALLGAALFCLCLLFPLIGDDWYREALGAAIHSPLDLIRVVYERWSTVNGRVMGNILAYTAGSRPLVRELMRSLFILALAALLSRVAGLRRWWGLLLAWAAAFALPREMFAQIYPWAAGFFNYLPPVVMLLACLALVRPVFEGQPMEERPGRWAALFLLGFGQQLFIENNTTYALFAALVLLVWYRTERKIWSPGLLAFFAGCVLGAALLFASPAYRGLQTGEGSYQSGLAGGLPGLVAAARGNLFEVARCFILECPVLFLSITALTVLLCLRTRRSVGHYLLAAALLAGCCGLLYGKFRPLWCAALWCVAVTAAIWLWTPAGAARRTALFLWLGAPVAAGPLLFVNPIGPRCLFLSYVLMLATAGVLLRAAGADRLPVPVTGGGAALLAGGVFAFYLAVFLPFHQVEQLRSRALQAAMEAEAAQVVLPAYDHEGFLWDADSDTKMELYYYHERPGDLDITFLPLDQWREVAG